MTKILLFIVFINNTKRKKGGFGSSPMKSDNILDELYSNNKL